MNFENKTAIKNRHGLTILVKFFECEKPDPKLAFIQHGYSGSMVETHITAFAKTYLDNGYNVLMMDCTNSFNDADGLLQDNTIQTHYDDLEDVIEWAFKQEWYQTPFALAGHSLGGLSTITYAAKHPDKVLSLFPAATVISGKHLEEANLFRSSEEYNAFKSSGDMTIECTYKNNVSGYRPYSWIETMWNWSALNFAKNITCPTLLLVGSNDTGTPPEHQKLFLDRLSSDKKDMHIIDGADHCYSDKIDKACSYLDTWLKKND